MGWPPKLKDARGPQILCTALEASDGHYCLLCLVDLYDREIDLIYNLADLEDSINIVVLYSILYIAGHVQKCDMEEISDDATTYNKKYGTYLNTLNRGRLTIPSDTLSVVFVLLHTFSFIS